MEKNATSASPAHALASIVLPVPGGPVNKAPLGIFAPISRYLALFLRKSTNYVIYFLACSIPATSLNLVLMSFKPSILKFFSPCPKFLSMEDGSPLLNIQIIKAMEIKGVTNPEASLRAET